MNRIIEDINKTIESLGYPSDFECLYDQIECLKSSLGKETFLVVNKKDKKSYIAKCYDKKIYSFTPEIKMLMSLNHDGIPKYIDNYENENYVIVVREYIEGVSLESYIKGNELSEKEKLSICYQLIDILIYLHNQDKPIIHRDIKPENIIVKDNGTICLIDFDIARTFKNEKDADTVFFGTKGYAPPEQYGFEQTNQKADIYAFGVLMRYLFTGDIHGDSASLKNIRIKKIIEKCTAFSPKDRYADMKSVKSELFGKGRKTKLLTAFLALIIAFCACLYLQNNSKVEFKEPLIEKAVRLQLNLDDSQKIKKEDLLKVKELYILGSKTYKRSDELYSKNPRNTIKGELSNLNDIELLPNLERVVIGYEGDIDISGLAKAENLQYLELKHVNIIDISPLTNLKSLNAAFLFDSGINDCRQLNVLTSLEHLDIGYTNINSFKQIGVFPCIKELSIKMLSMYSLDGIEKMPTIEVVWLNGAGIGNVSALAKLPSLKSVHTDQKYFDVISELLKDKNVEIICEE